MKKLENLNNVMEAETIQKNGASLKSLMSRVNFFKYVWIIAFGALIGLSAVSCGSSEGDSPDKESTTTEFSKMQEKWEYMVFNMNHLKIYGYDNNQVIQLNKRLNELGEEGWELVSTGSSGNSYNTQSDVFIFKRKL